PIYKVLFLNQGKVYEIYARNVSHGSLFGFVEVEKLVFGTRSTVVVDPTEERIKSEFEGVKRTFLPLHSVLRIDEVEKQGVSKMTKVEGGDVAQFPVTMYSPRGGGKSGPRDSCCVPCCRRPDGSPACCASRRSRAAAGVTRCSSNRARRCS